MGQYKHISVPAGEKIAVGSDGRLQTPDQPIVAFIEGDGTGPDIWRAAVRVLDAAVAGCYGGRRAIRWLEVLAGEKAFQLTGEWLPEQTVDAIRQYRVSIKGPLTTPVGGGIRSLNVTLRIVLDLYACVRPVRWYTGVPAPVTHPERLDVVIFRENTEDVYAGIEWAAGSEAAADVIRYLRERHGVSVRPDSGIGVKPISATGTRRLVRMAIDHALAHNRRRVTLVHKGNIMKFTEGAFRDWGYELARQEYADRVVTEEALYAEHGGQLPAGRVLLDDRIADAMFQQILLRPEEYDVLATPNLNGDYLSDACAAQVGGLGMAPGANIGDGIGLFEATHGTAPKYAGQDKVNPSSVILSGVMMLRHLGWGEAAEAIETALSETIGRGLVTYDLARQLPAATLLSTSAFAEAIAAHLPPAG